MNLAEMILKYVKEKEGLECIYNDFGFMFYKFEEDYLLITDVYVIEKERGKGYGKNLLNELKKIAKSKGVTKIRSVVGNHVWVNSSVLIQLILGFKIIGIMNNQIIFELEVNHG